MCLIYRTTGKKAEHKLLKTFLTSKDFRQQFLSSTSQCYILVTVLARYYFMLIEHADLHKHPVDEDLDMHLKAPERQ